VCVFLQAEEEQRENKKVTYDVCNLLTYVNLVQIALDITNKFI